nr:PREDICTED: protein FAM101B [Equus przewalskii]
MRPSGQLGVPLLVWNPPRALSFCPVDFPVSTLLFQVQPAFPCDCQIISLPCTNPASLPHASASACSPRLCPLSFGEGVEFDPLPPTEVRYTSSVKYDSERHFIDDVHLPLGLAVASCSQTVTCIPNCTWRNYKAEVRFEPRHKPMRFLSTAIVYPKYPKTVYTTTLDYNCRKMLRRFLSSVELEATEFVGGDYLSDEC